MIQNTSAVSSYSKIAGLQAPQQQVQNPQPQNGEAAKSGKDTVTISTAAQNLRQTRQVTSPPNMTESSEGARQTSAEERTEPQTEATSESRGASIDSYV